MTFGGMALLLFPLNVNVSFHKSVLILYDDSEGVTCFMLHKTLQENPIL